MNKEAADNINKKLIELEGKIKRLNIQKFLLFKELSESDKKSDLKINEAYYVDIEEQISYLNDWLEFNSKEIHRYKTKLEKLEQSPSKGQQETKDIEDSFKLIFKDEEKYKSIIDFKSLKTYAKYAIPFAVLLLIINGLFMLKPSTTGYATLSKETIYNKTLNLKINEGGNYTWVLDRQGTIKSIMASGSFKGNGTIRIYIEKDGKRYLIFDNKKQII